MKPNNFKLYTTVDRDDLIEPGDDIVIKCWPEFMLHDSVADQYFFELYTVFPEFQFWLIDEVEGKEVIVGIGNSIPLHFDGELNQLPEKGWDWALEKGFLDKEKGLTPNYQCALSITMNPLYKGRGVSKEMVKAMKSLGAKAGLKELILPVRPSQKSKYPLIYMDTYVNSWVQDDGLSTDPWVRVHQKLGGKIIKPCNKAMYIDGTVSDWEEWTGMKFFKSGKYVVSGALDTIDIDIEKDKGIYIEPNLWMVHELG